MVIFAAFLGVAALKLLKDDAPKGERVLTAIDTLQSWVMKLVRLVMQLTPYGVLALMTKVVAGSNLQDIIKLGSFVVARLCRTLFICCGRCACRHRILA